MAKIYDVVAVTGSYTKDGQEKKRYKNVGFINKNNDGHLSLKLDHLVTVDDDSKTINWFSLFEAEGQSKPKKEVNNDMEDEDIPF